MDARRDVVKGFLLDRNCRIGYCEAVPTTFPLHHGRISLSFAGTVGDRGSSPVERLPSPAALEAWLHAAGVAEVKGRVTPRTLSRALALREAIARVAAALVAHAAPAVADIARINAEAKAGTARVSLDPVSLAIVDAARDPVHVAIGRIARDAVELFGTPAERARLRACGLPSCGSVFLTPAGRRERRWCSMERCGNRAKVASFRERTRAT
jgi:predicted RNA-binding Zn ribbon-like protein